MGAGGSRLGRANHAWKQASVTGDMSGQHRTQVTKPQANSPPTRPTCLVLQLGFGQALLHPHPSPTPRIPVGFFWDVVLGEEA